MAAKPSTLGELRSSGYKVSTVKQEMRRNLIEKMRKGEDLFPGIYRLRRHRHPPAPERHPLRPGHHLPRRARPGEVAHDPRPRQPARRRDPGHRRQRGQRRPVRADLASTRRTCIADEGDRRRSTGSAATALRREARDARHHHRRPHRRGRPDQRRRRPLPLRRADDPLRPDPAHQPRHLRINELPDLAERIQVGLFNIMEERDIQIRGYRIRLPLDVFLVVQRQPGGLHQPRPHHHAAQGPLRRPDPHALPASRSSTRSASWSRSACASTTTTTRSPCRST